MELAQRSKWTEVVLRTLREGYRHFPDILDDASVTLEMRSEARLFTKANHTHFKYGAAIRHPGSDGPKPPSCHKHFFNGCQPSDSCHATGGNRRRWNEQTKCSLRDEVKESVENHNGFYHVRDLKLAGHIGGNPMGDPGVDELAALKVTITCGPKAAYG